MTSSVIPPFSNAFLPATIKYCMNLSIRLANFGATQPSVEKDLISPAILCVKDGMSSSVIVKDISATLQENELPVYYSL
jgi:hypothetical protein